MRKENKNFWLNVLDGGFFIAATNMLPFLILLPAYVKKFEDNYYIINFIPALMVLGTMTPQIFMAPYIESLKYKKKLMLLTGVFQRIPWLFLSIFTLYTNKVSKSVSLFLFFLCFGLYNFSTGINIPVWTEMIAKVTNVSKRGKLFATRHIIGGLLGIISSYIGKVILKIFPFPYNYSILFFLFFILTSVSLTFLFFLEEEPSKEIKKRLQFRDYIKVIPKILKRDKNYSNYIIATVIFSLTSMSGGLIISYGIDKFSLQAKDFILGKIAFIATISKLSIVFIFGWLADNWGHKINICISGFLYVIAFSALFINNISSLYFYFIINGIAQQVYIISGKTIVLEFCREIDRPTYISVLNTLTAPISFLAPFLGSFISKNLGYKFLFFISIFLSLIFLIYVIFSIREPRRRIKNEFIFKIREEKSSQKW